MPRGDRTGPMGMGPMTGRAAGYCAGYGVPGNVNPMPRRGFGMGWGGGRGWRHRYYATGLPGRARFRYPSAWDAPPTPEQEAESLKAQTERLKEQLNTINQRIAELEKEA